MPSAAPNAIPHAVKRSQRRADKRATERARIEAEKQAQAERDERAAEEISPAAQRLGTVAKRMPDGTTVSRIGVAGPGEVQVSNPRLVRDGNTFRVGAAPLETLALYGEGKEKRGKAATVTASHLRAADRFYRAWEIAASTPTAGVAGYEERGSSTPETGVLSGALQRTMASISDAKAECEAIIARVGANWPIIGAFVIAGWDLKRWAEYARTDKTDAGGALRTALDNLVWAYDERDGVTAGRTSAILSIWTEGSRPTIHGGSEKSA